MSAAHKILVVDDEIDILKGLEMLLASVFPGQVLCTDSPYQAVDILRREKISVLLCDMGMPGLDGNAVFIEAKKCNPHTVSILLTARADKDSIIKAINEGAIWKYLSKPCHNQDLMTIIKDAVGRYETFSEQQTKLDDLVRHMADEIRSITNPGDMDLEQNRPLSDSLQRSPGQHQIKQAFVPLEPGQKVDARYKIIRLVRRGGIGNIYLAEDTLLGMQVAIKTLSSDYSSNEEQIAILKAEARMAMQLSHKHIVRLYNLQMFSGFYYLVMEYIQGCTFRDILTRYGKFSPSNMLKVAKVCADALGYAHRRGVLHRDIKPDNFMLTEEGVIKLIDFGLASLVGNQPDAHTIVGTPHYVSPEEVKGLPLDQTSDVYSLGVVFHELLTGHLPFPKTDNKKLALNPELVLDAGLSDKLKSVFAMALAMDRNERWASVEAFMKAFSSAIKQSIKSNDG